MACAGSNPSSMLSAAQAMCRTSPAAAWPCRQPHSVVTRPAARQRAPGLAARAAAETEQLTAGSEAGAAPAEQQQQDSGGRLAAGGKRVAVLQAAKRAFLDVKEQGRPLGEASLLPGSMQTCRHLNQEQQECAAPHHFHRSPCPAPACNCLLPRPYPPPRALRSRVHGPARQPVLRPGRQAHRAAG